MAHRQVYGYMIRCQWIKWQVVVLLVVYNLPVFQFVCRLVVCCMINYHQSVYHVTPGIYVQGIVHFSALGLVLMRTAMKVTRNLQIKRVIRFSLDTGRHKHCSVLWGEACSGTGSPDIPSPRHGWPLYLCSGMLMEYLVKIFFLLPPQTMNY